MDETSDTSRRSKDRKATEKRLLSAAESVFARRGFDAAGVREIAEEAQANVSLINRYFGGKEGLLLALTERFLEAKSKEALLYPRQHTLADEIEGYLHHRLADDRKNQALVRLIVSRIAIDAKFREQAMRPLDGRADVNFRERIERLKERGAVSRDTEIDLLYATVAYFSFSANFFCALIEDRADEEIDAMFSAFARTVGKSCS